jgi:large subunit ribosomal protein L35
MPKLKTKKAIAKRFKVTATGKVRFKRAGLRHNTGHVRPATTAKRRHDGVLYRGDAKLLETGFPYGLK